MTRPDRLNCEELFRRLDDYVDRELAEAEAELVRRHLETCAVCAAEYSFETSMLQGVREKLRRIQAPAGLLERITRKIRESEGGGH